MWLRLWPYWVLPPLIVLGVLLALAEFLPDGGRYIIN